MKENNEILEERTQEEREFYIRKMDDMGRISIPEAIQKYMGFKKSELPSFEIKIHTEQENPFIGLHLLDK